jgi:CRISPR/Cas system-associated exonuclease Cas4 (RecB family)
MAVLLRSPDEYRPHLEEAFARAEVPAHFAQGAVRPDPAGRAFCALLACAAEQLSARRFAEYLSLGELPDADAAGAPPAAVPRGERWVAPDEELVAEALADALGEARVTPEDVESAGLDDPDAAPVAAGSLRAPRRWEQLLVDAAVIGGRQRWERRLDGLARSLDEALRDFDDPTGPEPQRLARDLADLAALRAFALPLLDDLAWLPARARWGEWVDALSALATRALRRPERVLAVLAELAPMAEVADVSLAEVQGVLAKRLLSVSVPPAKRRYGRVFVAPAESARGLAFDVVFVPGLAERLFPRKIAEEPILLDAARERLAAGLATNAERVARERRALRLAVGAARERVLLSYPRLDLDEARPRVPSFYALEALRAAEGALPGFDELAKRAETLADARVGWPAPRRPEDAIDEAEHDLALLDSLLRLDPEKSTGTARFLLSANVHLGRALRFRSRRWWKKWTWADGLMPPTEPAREAVAAHARAALAANAIGARSFSPTALQHYAACPYRFYLQAIARLAPREVPEAIEEMDPLQRGSLVHEVQFALFQRLAKEGLLPVTRANLAAARERLDEALDAAAERKRDEWAPAIERVWEDGIESIRADLREWLRRASEDDSGFVPWKFELAFGLPGRRDADPDSTPEPVTLDSGIRLRGSIDLVERRSGDGALRATDHKTGKERVAAGDVVRGGEALQPVLYALALEKRFPQSAVEGGRLSYCTAAGGFAERVVPLDAEARRASAVLAAAIDEAIDKPWLPAAPADGACRWCDYRVVCGPYEEMRTKRKPKAELAALEKVRKLR